MKYRQLPYVDKPVSEIIYGTATPEYLDGNPADEILEGIFSLGINTIDTARNYKLSEKSIGHWLENYGHRDEIVLLSKCGHPEDGRKRVNEKDMREDFAVSSEYLHTNFIDIYLLHRDDPDVDVGTIVEIFNALHAEGKIGAFGGSNWTHERIEAANEYAYKKNLIPFTVSSPNFGLAHQAGDPWGWGTVTITGEENADAREWYRKNQMPVIAYSSLARGLFSGRLKGTDFEKASSVLDEAGMKGYGYPENFKKLARCEELAAQKGCTVTQIALSWIYRQGINAFAVVSTKNPERMKTNIAALDIPLSEEESEYLSGK
ncbi:MAG: aldo/keto reductase [Eubacteriales bacterium]|nr:aldo/keto reductase [Eubacteriales bacterium]